MTLVLIGAAFVVCGYLAMRLAEWLTERDWQP